MPRIDDRYLECVVYLYPTAADARDGSKSGGCGFWISVPSALDLLAHLRETLGQALLGYYQHIYVVTNSHVIREGGSRFLRINKLSGGYDVIETRADGWTHHPDGDDVAIYKLEYSIFEHQVKQADLKMFVTKELIRELNIGPGDDAFVVGRFISHDGKQQNLPYLRFGNIAMMPWEPILNRRGLRQESFLVESRSLGGASGSPVFVRIPWDPMGRPGVEKKDDNMGVWLLGVNWGHPPLVDVDFTSVLDRDGTPHADGWRVQVNTGIMCVVPAWKIRDILDLPEHQEKRRADELRVENAMKRSLIAEMDQSKEEKQGKDC